MKRKKRKLTGTNMLAGAALVMGIGLGTVLAVWQTDDAPAPDAGGTPTRGEAWYRTQPQPPTLPTLPDTPIFPEGMEAHNIAAARAYEEALPEDIYISPPKPAIPKPEPKTIETEPAWKRFAVSAPPGDGKPRIAVVIDDMGVDRKRSPQIVSLPGPLTLSYLTYADDLVRQTNDARNKGHELMLHVSMEPLGKGVDPGPNVLMVGSDVDELRRRLEWGLTRFDGYVGVNNHMGSRFTADAAGMVVVMDEISKRGLLFLDSRTTGKSVAGRIAHEKHVPLLERNVFIDNVGKADEIAKRLAEAERFAAKHGHAIVIGHPRSATVDALRTWLPTLAARGFQLVPVTALLKTQARVAAAP